MESITSRTRYLDKYTTNGVNEYDLGSFTQTDFDFGDPIYIQVEHEEVGRPDLISQWDYEKNDKGTVTRKYSTARGQQN